MSQQETMPSSPTRKPEAEAPHIVTPDHYYDDDEDWFGCGDYEDYDYDDLCSMCGAAPAYMNGKCCRCY